MTTRDFCFWLQGHFELKGKGPTEPMTVEQVDMIKRHLHMVFVHEIDPTLGGDKAQGIHDGVSEEEAKRRRERALTGLDTIFGPHGTGAIVKC